MEQRRIRLRRLLPQLGFDASGKADEDLDALSHEYRGRYEAASRLFPDVVDSLTRLASRYRLAVLTNRDQVQQHDEARRTGLSALVEATMAKSTRRQPLPRVSPTSGSIAWETLRTLLGF